MRKRGNYTHPAIFECQLNIFHTFLSAHNGIIKRALKSCVLFFGRPVELKHTFVQSTQPPLVEKAIFRCTIHASDTTTPKKKK